MKRLRVDGLGVKAGGRVLLEPVDLDLQPGELLGLIGPNGAGKSTLVQALAQLRRHSGGCLLDGEPLESMPAMRRARQLAYLAQADTLQWPLSVEALVALGRHPHRARVWPGSAKASGTDDGVIDRVLAVTGITHLRGRRIDTLSGGERALARLARVLAVEAGLLVLDEPVASLDPRHQLEVMRLLRAQCDDGVSVLVVLHDLTLASRFCDRLLLLDRGHTVVCGDAHAVLDDVHLRRVYGIESLVGQQGDERYIVPWRSVLPAPGNASDR
jgi:iron complex transport system ATP-binding protein